jgi:sugar lactone lactonase YvrE
LKKEQAKMSSVEHIVSVQSCLGEGPIWHPTEQVLYWLDIVNGQLHRYDPTDHVHKVHELGVVTGSMGLRASGGFVLATRSGFAFWDRESGKLTYIDNPDADENGDVRFNDGKTDPQGRFWAGKMSNQSTNSLFRLDPDRSIHRMESGIGVSNGLGWSPDHRTFYFTDSPAHEIYAYDFDPDTGDISNRRIFASIPNRPEEGVPDGLAIDVEGCIWSARWGGWKIVRYAPDGSIEREIPMPVEFPTSCAFGGANLDELYITSAWVEIKEGMRGGQPMAGDIFRFKTPVRGFPEPFFAG